MKRTAPIRSLLAAGCTGLALAAAATGPASAHEAHGKPMYGGVVAEAGSFQGELVNAPKGATLYLTDHGQPIASAGATAKVVVLAGGTKSELEFVPAGDNRLAAPGGATLAAGSKAVDTVKLKDGRSGALRFDVK
jgi:hypothetical protein